jgi:hypothetical protein
MSEKKITVVCVRDPDWDNDYTTFGGEVSIIDIDRGRMDLRDPSECIEWAESHLTAVKDEDEAVQAHVADIVLSTVQDLDYDDVMDYVMAEGALSREQGLQELRDSEMPKPLLDHLIELVGSYDDED